MSVEELIKYSDEFNKKVLYYEKKNKVWKILFPLILLVAILLIIVPAMIVGDNNGQPKPLYFDILVNIGLVLVLVGLVFMSIYFYNKINAVTNKKYKEVLSHELNSLVYLKKTHTEKEFNFLNKINK